MRGKTVLISGSTSGIGKETARGLAKLGAHVILVGRDKRRAEYAVDEIKKDTGNDQVVFFIADLAKQRDIRQLVEQVSKTYDHLDVLINNTGVNLAKRVLTEDGVEMAFAVNVLAPYMLTHLFMPLLKRSTAARVINITGGLPDGPIDLENLQGEKRYLGWTFTQYNHSKTIMMAMSYSLAKSVEGSNVTINIAYPGHGYTPMNKSLPIYAYPKIYRPIVPVVQLLAPVFLADLKRSARSSIYLASSPEVEQLNGRYFNQKCQQVKWPKSVLDKNTRNVIWELCQKLSSC